MEHVVKGAKVAITDNLSGLTYVWHGYIRVNVFDRTGLCVDTFSDDSYKDNAIAVFTAIHERTQLS